jgi:hypothetical protein
MAARGSGSSIRNWCLYNDSTLIETEASRAGCVDDLLPYMREAVAAGEEHSAHAVLW